MNRNIDYKDDYVDTNRIDVENKEIQCNELLGVRSLLTIPLKGRENKSETIQLIMMNPSKAGKDNSDNTMNSVIEHIYGCPKFNQAKEITVSNLFPFSEPESSNLRQIFDSNSQNSLFQEELAKNRDKVDELVKSADSIILAYGDNPAKFRKIIHQNEVNQLLHKLIDEENIYAFSYQGKDELSKQGNPYHPGRKRINGVIRIKVVEKQSRTFQLSTE